METKSTEGLPFPMIFSGTLVSISWLLYGIIIENGFVIFQNVVVFLLSVVQLSLFVIYPSKPKSDSKKEQKEKILNAYLPTYLFKKRLKIKFFSLLKIRYFILYIFFKQKKVTWFFLKSFHCILSSTDNIHSKTVIY